MPRERLLFIAWAVFVPCVLVPRAARGQGGAPLGPEFRVNTYTTGDQYSPVVVSDTVQFVVVWTSDLQDGSGRGIFGQRYDSSGPPAGPEFRINTYTTGNQYAVAAAEDGFGSFTVVWSSSGQDGSATGVFGQRYMASGALLGPEFRVNTFTTDFQTNPAIDVDANGGLVVVWQGHMQDGSSPGVFGQRYASSGAPLGPEFRVNTYTTSSQEFPSVASEATGEFVVVWESNDQDGSGFGIFGQRFDALGAPLGPEFRVNTFTTGIQRFPAVASDFSGNFVVAWQSDAEDGSGYGVFGQRFNNAGVPVGPEFLVNTFTPGNQADPQVAADGVGDFVVIWRSNAQDGSGSGVFGQRYGVSGSALGGEFRVNTFTTGYQSGPSVTSGLAGQFIVAWGSALQDGSVSGVFGQRYGPIVPVELMRFEVE